MSKKEWFEAYMATKKSDVQIKVNIEGIAWAGFWIGLGIALAADIVTNHTHFFS